MNINDSNIVDQRLHNQRLSWSAFRTPVDVAHWLGAVQAQDFNGAKWALAQRMRATTETAIAEAYNEGTILRTHLMRPTWHFVAADDIRWLLELTAPRVNMACASNYRKLELDASIFNRCNKALIKALRDGTHLTRDALREVVNRAGVAADDSVRFGHILLRAELDGVVCSGRSVGGKLTYALLDERLAETRTRTKPLTREEALAKLTRRYFTSHGPATLQDFVWWSGLTAADAKNGHALAQRDLTKALMDEKEYWMLPSAKPEREPSRSAHLLPAFDEYLVAYKDRKAAVNVNDAELFMANSGGLGPTIVLEGRVAGTWKRTIDRTSVMISLKLFRPMNRRQKRALDEATDRYAAYLGVKPKISIL